MQLLCSQIHIEKTIPKRAKLPNVRVHYVVHVFTLLKSIWTQITVKVNETLHSRYVEEEGTCICCIVHRELHIAANLADDYVYTCMRMHTVGL